jgi:hypothetical protein
VKLAQIPVHLADPPPYSLDLAPSDFFLFGDFKQKLLGLELDSPAALLDSIKAEFETIPSEVVEEVFEGWIIGVQKYIECQGDYFLKD